MGQINYFGKRDLEPADGIELDLLMAVVEHAFKTALPDLLFKIMITYGPLDPA
ncbi:hypothetical protein DXG01_015988 [Tephrocybe rancida]|nr:hypothetical protein DXG01_015988 [Tephrocybe rancida]